MTARTSQSSPSEKKSSSGKFTVDDLFKLFSGEDKVLIVINADPDAIASALALKRLLWRRVASVAVSSINQVKRLDNLNLLAYLNLTLLPFSQVDMDKYSKLAMVDSQPSHNDLTRQLEFDLIIDHHPPVTAPAGKGRARPQIIDIRQEYGAVASMMFEYLRQAKVMPSQKLATALFYAIKTDTQNFVRQGQLEDMHAFRGLYPYINQNALVGIDRATLPRRSFKYLVQGLQLVNFKGSRAYTFMEKIDNPDTLVILADLLLHINTISLVVVAGLFKDRVVLIFRAAGRLNAGRLASEAFGAYGSAGGHKTMARAELPLAGLAGHYFGKSGRPGSVGAINRFIRKHLNDWHSRRVRPNALAG